VIADEVNVKKVELKGIHLALTTNVTDELREEGIVRDAIRGIQAFRKESGLKPGEQATYKAKFSDAERLIVRKNQEFIEKATHTAIEFD